MECWPSRLLAEEVKLSLKTSKSKRSYLSSITSSVVVKWVFIFSLTSPWVMDNQTCQLHFITLTHKRINTIKLWGRSEVFFKTTIMIRSSLFMVSEVSWEEHLLRRNGLLTALRSMEIFSTLKLLVLKPVSNNTVNLYPMLPSMDQPFSSQCLSKWMDSVMENLKRNHNTIKSTTSCSSWQMVPSWTLRKLLNKSLELPINQCLLLSSELVVLTSVLWRNLMLT